jgi:hypothetical protein
MRYIGILGLALSIALQIARRRRERRSADTRLTTTGGATFTASMDWRVTAAAKKLDPPEADSHVVLLDVHAARSPVGPTIARRRRPLRIATPGLWTMAGMPRRRGLVGPHRRSDRFDFRERNLSLAGGYVRRSGGLAPDATYAEITANRQMILRQGGNAKGVAGNHQQRHPRTCRGMVTARIAPRIQS